MSSKNLRPWYESFRIRDPSPVALFIIILIGGGIILLLQYPRDVIGISGDIIIFLLIMSACLVFIATLLKIKRDLNFVVNVIEGSNEDHFSKGSISVSFSEKKNVFQKIGLKTFYYLDKNAINDMYFQMPEELEPQRIETRESHKSRKGITAKLQLVEPKFEKDRAEETTKIYNMEFTPSMMYKKVENYLLQEDKVTFELDEFKYDKSSIDDFKSMCDQMRKKFGFDIPDDFQEKYISEKMKDFALHYVNELSSSIGYIALLTEFSIIDTSDAAYILSFVHPLNEYLPKEDKVVRIQITCAKECMTPLGLSTFKKGNSVKVTCIAKVVSWNSEDKILVTSPIAIY